jgi:hypothetical protein
MAQKATNGGDVLVWMIMLLCVFVAAVPFAIYLFIKGCTLWAIVVSAGGILALALVVVIFFVVSGGADTITGPLHVNPGEYNVQWAIGGMRWASHFSPSERQRKGVQEYMNSINDMRLWLAIYKALGVPVREGLADDLKPTEVSGDPVGREVGFSGNEDALREYADVLAEANSRGLSEIARTMYEEVRGKSGT